METCGLVSLEAALAGAPLVGSTFGHELEYLEGDLVCRSRRCRQPAGSGGLAYKAGRNHPRTIAMKRKGRTPTRERTVDTTEKVYRRVLNEK